MGKMHDLVIQQLKQLSEEDPPECYTVAASICTALALADIADTLSEYKTFKEVAVDTINENIRRDDDKIKYSDISTPGDPRYEISNMADIVFERGHDAGLADARNKILQAYGDGDSENDNS